MNMFTRLALCIAAGSLLLAGCGKDGKDGRDGRDATAAPVSVASLTTDQWSDLAPKGEVLSVSINSPPVVKFKVTDANGNPLVGLGNSSKSSTATVASYSNVSFALAKLVPGTNGSPSKWVSYIVTTVPTTTTAATATRPTTDNTGTLVDHGDGTYTYTSSTATSPR
ncbi:hypothetical protein [Trichlorobacter ammonificans]|uniref:Lipoprotein n=1 Tax=Trichlorobacter ammonificans TaxID=2916410 RepID=A0ABM9DBQ9_9BACT|nr:hypothetical protein [Trichlorobacter ammonificans]CAH2031779.1 protein of unknown function [Trichlorobacter ammonificans]